MCTDCGCGGPELISVDLHAQILGVNDAQARHNRAHLAQSGVTAINVMGSPGAGKTALLEATAAGLQQAARPAPDVGRLVAISADLETDRDAKRLTRAGIEGHAITTGTVCHLDAAMVHRALHGLSLDHADYLFIENVGNLVCPAVYDLGQAANVVALSVTEGPDKPVKYPPMFRKADLVILTKVDLLPHLPGVSLDEFIEAVGQVAPEAQILAFSAVTGQGLEGWVRFLAEARRAALESPVATASSHSHAHHHHSHAVPHDHSHDHSHEHDHGHQPPSPTAHDH